MGRVLVKFPCYWQGGGRGSGQPKPPRPKHTSELLQQTVSKCLLYLSKDSAEIFLIVLVWTSALQSEHRHTEDDTLNFKIWYPQLHPRIEQVTLISQQIMSNLSWSRRGSAPDDVCLGIPFHGIWSLGSVYVQLMHVAGYTSRLNLCTTISWSRGIVQSAVHSIYCQSAIHV